MQIPVTVEFPFHLRAVFCIRPIDQDVELVPNGIRGRATTRRAYPRNVSVNRRSTVEGPIENGRRNRGGKAGELEDPPCARTSSMRGEGLDGGVEEGGIGESRTVAGMLAGDGKKARGKRLVPFDGEGGDVADDAGEGVDGDVAR